jgi:type IV pilus assembly protein PilA
MYDFARRRPLTGWLSAASRVTFLLLLVADGTLITPPDNIIRLHDEAAAVTAIRMIQRMQFDYNSQYGRFASSLTELGPPASGTADASSADLIDSALAAGEESGYKFTMTGNQSSYAISAVPVAYGNTGSRTFYSDQNRAIRENDGPEPATASNKEMR